VSKAPVNISEWLDESDLIDLSIAYELGFIRTITPGIVQSYDAKTQTARVQPVIRDNDIVDEEVIHKRLPPVANAPVMFPSGGGFAIAWPLKKGDRVLLLVCDRSIDEWSGGDGEDITPRDPREHDLTDAVVYPGTRPKARPLSFVATDNALVLGHDSATGAKLKLTSTTVAIGTPAVELVDQVESLATQVVAMEAALTVFTGSLNTATDPGVKGAAGVLKLALEPIRTSLLSTKTKLNSIKGSL
jgi:hypothetical protein